MGTVFSYTRGSKPFTKNSKVCGSSTSYKTFIMNSIEYSKKCHNIDIMVLDNRKATIPGMLIRKKIKPGYIIQDCRELYLLNEVKHLTGKIGCIFEKRMAKKADIVICANEERAQIMQQIYSLSNKPITYENLRRLEYSVEDNIEDISEKFREYIREDEIRIVSSSGCSIDRTNDVLVRNFKNVKKNSRLFLVGNYSEKENSIIQEIIAKNEINNVTILGQLNQAELKYLIANSHIGIVNYGQYDTNNKYCASGKLYEFLYEGVPVVTTTNPPLKRLCEVENIGIADDDYYKGINSIIENYGYFKERVKLFSERNTIITNDQKLIAEIEEKLKSITL